mmetsp:Transcript_37779/g.87436  ORF Transcript_37779/g.87436 Transcript_37779/m.87436 type:complete len:242 (-) Transcript_37779:20-745(-)
MSIPRGLLDDDECDFQREVLRLRPPEDVTARFPAPRRAARVQAIQPPSPSEYGLDLLQDGAPKRDTSPGNLIIDDFPRELIVREERESPFGAEPLLRYAEPTWYLAWVCKSSPWEDVQQITNFQHAVNWKGGTVARFQSPKELQKWVVGRKHESFVLLTDEKMLYACCDALASSAHLPQCPMGARRRRVTHWPAKIFLTSYGNYAPHVDPNCPVPVTAVAFDEFGFQQMASQSFLSVLGLA